MPTETRSGASLDAAAAAAARPRAATLRRSCEACRTMKARCIVPPAPAEGACPGDQPRRCQRCVNNGLKCVFEHAIARPKKLKYSARTRVQDMEEKLDGLIALISAQKEADHDAATPSTGAQADIPMASTAPGMPDLQVPLVSSLFELPEPSTAAGLIVGSTANEGFLSYDAFSAPEELHFLPPLHPQPDDVIGRGILSEQLAIQLVAAYGPAAKAAFPFVLLNPDPKQHTSDGGMLSYPGVSSSSSSSSSSCPFSSSSSAYLARLRRDRPYLLLGVLAAMSSPAGAGLQARLAAEFRAALAQAAVVESRKSLDLLQGLLVFCAWHHRYFNPDPQQLYQLSQMAITMAVDLGLPHRVDFVCAARSSGGGENDSGGGGGSHPNDRYFREEDIEAVRAYLGCYYLSSSVAISQHKPTHLRHSRRIAEAVRFLSSPSSAQQGGPARDGAAPPAALSAPSDALLLPWHMRIRRLAEDVESVINKYGEAAAEDEIDEVRMGALAAALEREVEEMRAEMPGEVWDNTSIKLAMLYLPVQIGEVSLRVPRGEHHVTPSPPFSCSSSNSSSCPPENPPQKCCAWCTSPTRLSLALSCVRAAAAFLSAYLSLPAAELAGRASAVDCGRHLDAVLVLARGALGREAARLSPRARAVAAAELLRCLEMSERAMGRVCRYLSSSSSSLSSSTSCASATPSGVSPSPSANNNNNQAPQRDYFWQLRQVFRHSVAWYRRFASASRDNDILSCDEAAGGGRGWVMAATAAEADLGGCTLEAAFAEALARDVPAFEASADLEAQLEAEMARCDAQMGVMGHSSCAGGGGSGGGRSGDGMMVSPAPGQQHLHHHMMAVDQNPALWSAVANWFEM